ncbi:acyl-CoA dehydrogenase [Methylocella silvestris]|uniref:Acyl-CoA dehydrogenase n=2 Tax=Methylocella silvestris TaxID=199596 RepID=A0A2J7TC76_METSI|nr:acyl-CoA dehydrogenase family protein [Methylocella silvestris]PNG24366.1 acyl-CoA dehydrogenase [Methylocella silvestris]
MRAEVSHIARGVLAGAAPQIDEGRYPLDIMGSLGAAGAFSPHLDAFGARFDLALEAMHEVSRSCGATGFLTWCQDVCGLYLEQSGNPALTARLVDHAMGRRFGGTGLSNPVKALAGIEPMLLRARKVKGGYLVNGSLPWVSHIGAGQYCGAMAAVEGDDGKRSHEIMFLIDFDGCIELKPCPEFSGMEGTSTWRIPLSDYFVGEDAMIADPARPFIARIRAPFILLQVGMATGVIAGAIDSMRDVEPALGHVNCFLQDRPDEIQAELDELTGRVAKLVAAPYDGGKDYLMDVIDARAQGGELALRAAQSAMLHQGARGYLRSAAPQRRMREAQFIAIVTPAIKHLRFELDRLMREETPQ